MSDYKDKKHELDELWNKVKEQISVLDSNLSKFVFLRLIAFLLIPIWIYLYFGGSWIMWVGVIVFTALFLVLVKKNALLVRELDFLKRKKKVASMELSAAENDYTAFPSGTQFVDPSHPFLSDLDVFGPDSLFKRMCRSISLPAQVLLAHRLAAPFVGEKEWKLRKQAMKEWIPKLETRMDLFAHGESSALTAVDAETLLTLVQNKSFIKSQLLNFLCVFVPVYSLSFLVLLFLDFISLSQFLYLLIVPFTIAGYYFKKVNLEYDAWSGFLSILQSYSEQITLVLAQDWSSEINQNNARNLDGANHALMDLKKIISSFDQRNNMLLGVPLNLFLLWDLQQIRRLETWKSSYGSSLKPWIDALVECEYYASAASYLWINAQEICEANLSSKSSLWFTMKDGVHPFMKKSAAVANDIHFDEDDGMMIITGANMAGKSTFLRSIGTNVILSFCLGHAHASAVEFNSFALFSSMRTSDSVQKGESYFFNELSRLKFIVDGAALNEKVVVLLDEILKGTNSEDKARGSKLFVEKLLEQNIKGIIATHDLSLCELEKLYPSKIKNRSFEVEIKDDGLHFDYKLRDGICHTMNASYLLKSMGLSPDNSKI